MMQASITKERVGETEEGKDREAEWRKLKSTKKQKRQRKQKLNTMTSTSAHCMLLCSV